MAGEPWTSDALTSAHARIGRYRPLSRLGEGGMGVVYLAEDEALDRRVALKLLSPALASSAEFRDRFVRESRLAASIEHPNIVPIYDFGEADGDLFIAMRLIQGVDLRRLLENEAPLDPARAAGLIDQIAAALDAAHRVGLVHRDVKPGNVMVDRTSGRDHCYLTDFGLTKNVSATSGYTATGQIVGTPAYIAPEQLVGAPVRPTADVYALGCVLFECLTGSIPFPREHDIAMIYAHMQDPPPSAWALRRELPGGLDSVLARAMAKSPDERYESCGEFAGDVRAALGGATIPAFEPQRSVPRRFARPEPPRATEPSPPAAPPRHPTPATPVPMWAPPPVAAAAPPRRRRRSGMRAAVIVAMAILLCAGAVTAALLLRDDGNGTATSAAARERADAQRILRETRQLRRDIQRDIARARQGQIRSVKELRTRLTDYRQRAEDLRRQAQTQLEQNTELQNKLTAAYDKYTEGVRRWQKLIADRPTILVEPRIIGIFVAGDENVDAAGQSLPEPELPGPVDVPSAVRTVKLPGDAVARISGDSITGVTNAGDVDGAGSDDLLVTTADAAYVVFAPQNGGSVDLNDLGDRGFEIADAASAAPLGDVTDDGKADIGVTDALDPTLAYVVRGTDATDEITPGSGDDSIELTLPSGATPLDPGVTGAVTAAGDVNGEGAPDLLVGAPLATGGTALYVVYGETLDTSGGLVLDELEADQGFAIADGGAPMEATSWAAAGDLDADNADDVVVGDPSADGGGAAYVIYGGNGDDVDVSDLGDAGFAIAGPGGDAAAGSVVRQAGDFDGDGSYDVLVGAPGASPHGRDGAGAAFIVRGSDQRPAAPVQLDSPGDRAIAIAGPEPAADPSADVSGSLGTSAAVAGDLDGDGSDDLLLGSAGLAAPAAAAYVVFGGDTGAVDLADPGDRATAVEMTHDRAGGPLAVGGNVDFDGDGAPDLFAVGDGGADVFTAGG